VERWEDGESRRIVDRDWQPATHRNGHDDRLDTVFGDTAALLVLAHRPSTSRLGAFASNIRMQGLDTDNTAVTMWSTNHTAAGATVGNLACEIYISGSTGAPKGGLVGHRPSVRCTDDCHFGPGKGFLDLVPLAFDATIFVVWDPFAEKRAGWR